MSLVESGENIWHKPAIVSLLTALAVTIMMKCYPDSHVLNQSTVVIVTVDDVGPAAPVSLCAHLDHM